MGFFIFFLFLGAIIFIFSSKTFSPIPYFPSQRADLPLIIKALNLKNNQTVTDLGAGDGLVIFKAAESAYKRSLNTQFIAVEINPVLILIMNVQKLFHPNRKNIKIVLDDIFKMDLSLPSRRKSGDIVFYLYISPWYLEKVIENCKLKIVNFRVVSYMYPVKSLKKKEGIIKGKNSIFVYNL